MELYYPFGLEIKPLARDGGNRWKYNASSELNPSTNWYETDFRPYDQQVGRFTGVDALAEEMTDWTPYHYGFNNPVSYNDPTGLWPIYSADGEYLGDDGRTEKGKDLAFTGTAIKDKDGNITGYEDLLQFTDNHTQFVKAAGKVKKESSGDAEESLWIAHTANNATKNPDTKKGTNAIEQLLSSEYSTTDAPETKTSDNSSGTNNARKALIHVLSGGSDPTGGATHWDGQDFLPKGLSHNKYKEYGQVLINGKHLESFINSQTRLYKTKVNSNYNKDCTYGNKQSTGGWGYTDKGDFLVLQRGDKKTYYNLSSVAVKGGTLFWKAEKKR